MDAIETRIESYTPEEMMTVAAARELRAGMTCFVGVGPPSLAANLARATHAPDIILIYESGTIGAKPTRLPLSIGDGDLAETADAVVSVPEIFNYWVQPGRIDVGFLGAAQIDRHGNINTTVIGDYRHPSVRLPGAGGAPEIAASTREVIVIVKHSRRTFVDRLDFVTSVGRPPSTAEHARPITVITDLGILRADHATGELTLTEVHAGVSPEQVRAATGWDLGLVEPLGTTQAPTGEELAAIERLRAAGRTSGSSS
jgi:glutaconate CoA-transferase, subunit B